MTSRTFKAFCLRWIDATILIGLVIVPLYFNIHALYPFEPSKSVLLSVTATTLIGIVAIYLLVATGQSPTPELKHRHQNSVSTSPLRFQRFQPIWQRLTPPQRAMIITFSLYLLVQVLSTAASLAPNVSWWGSVPRLQGTFQLLLLAAAVGVVAWRWQGNDHERLDRLLAVIFLGAIPVGLYAMVQRLELDPVAWSHVMQGRVGSTFGNPIFVSAYAVLILMLATARLLETWQEFRTARSSTVTTWKGVSATLGWLAAGHVPLVGLIAGTPGFSDSWWPILPAIATYGIVCVHVSTFRVGPALRGLGLALLIVIHLSVLTMAIARGPLLAFLGASALLAVLLAQRLGQRVLALTMIATIMVATLGVIALNVPSLPLGELRQGRTLRLLSPLAVPDASRTIRMRVVAWRAGFEAWRIGPTSSSGRHDHTLLRQALGWGPELFDIAYNQMVSPSKYPDGDFKERWDRAHNVFIDLLVTSGLLGIGSWILMMASAGWCGVVAVRQGPRPIIACGLLAALAAHLVELQSAFVTSASGWSIWTIVAILAIQARVPSPARLDGKTGSPSSKRPRSKNRHRSLARTLSTNLASGKQSGYRGWVVGTWVLLSGVFLTAVSAGWLTLSPYSGHLWSTVWLAALTVLYAVRDPVQVQRRQRSLKRGSLGFGRLVSVTLVILGTFLFVSWHWRVLAADIYAKAGYQGTAPWTDRAATLQLALRLAPTYDLYPVLLGEVLLRQLIHSQLKDSAHPNQEPMDPIKVAPDQWERLGRNSLTEVARGSFGRTLTLNPWHHDAYAQLGSLEAQVVVGPGKLEAASRAHQSAVTLRPSNMHSWISLAKLRVTQGKLNSARKVLLSATEVDPQYAVGLVMLGDLEIQLGNTVQGWEYLWEALSIDAGSWFDDEFTYRVTRALENGKRNKLLESLAAVPPHGATAASHRVYGYVLFRMQHWKQARNQLTAALKGTSQDWWVQTHLALTLNQLGEVDLAREAAETAVKMTPVPQQSIVQKALVELLRAT